MSVQRERKVGLLLIGLVVLVIVVMTTLQSCSQYTCPTYQ
jgi:hypothetical protein